MFVESAKDVREGAAAGAAIIYLKAFCPLLALLSRYRFPTRDVVCELKGEER